MTRNFADMRKTHPSQMQPHFTQWLNSNECTIWDAYRRPSAAKVHAYRNCVELEKKLDGWGGRITGHNTCFFGYGFRCEVGGVHYFCYINAYGSYYCKMDDLK